MDRYAARRDKLRRLIKKAKADALLITNFTNVTYLTGFTGDDSYLLVGGDEAVLLSDPRYTTQLKEECPGLATEIRPPGTSMMASIKKVAQRAKAAVLGIEATSMTVAVASAIGKELAGIELAPCNGLVEQLREIKDRHEIASLKGAVVQAERAFGVIRSSLRGEQTELAVAHEIEAQVRLFGGRGCSFPPIVAVGPRAALPHARPTNQTIDAAGFVLIDWGADGADGYKSDLTRVLVTGKISPKLEAIYRVVLRAQERAIAAIRPGVTGRKVDAVARKIIDDAGFGKYFGHGLGHGLGLDIHEGPRLAKNNDRPLKAGMVVTVEPGIYLPGFGGVRIEDDVLVTRGGHEVLTGVAKQWEESQLPW
ncbi:MAG: aminopeptidase P family protein [Planctomycetota bacterium]|nr:MAG: aminopeptidase P family protein [Planctomycetota bacterium]REJ95787.1 MAG: aminopeptidase P family protein [Planctomycetota bacterium]REK25362.1 MAG: aminopeptidase P family protein [Planctomycetota bacterium]REK43497.1 MAG: aminopeptidase P family protein [Planctomycetota bacterium]